MINFDNLAKKTQKRAEHNSNCQHRILITGGSGSTKTNSLFNLISHQPDIDKVYLYTKDPYEEKNQLSINTQ